MSYCAIPNILNPRKMNPTPKQCNDHSIQDSHSDCNMYVNVNFQSNNAQPKIQNVKSTVKGNVRSNRQEEIMLPIFHSQSKISLPICPPPSKTHQLRQSWQKSRRALPSVLAASMTRAERAGMPEIPVRKKQARSKIEYSPVSRQDRRANKTKHKLCVSKTKTPSPDKAEPL
jgi:hypothetical protein